MGNEIHIEKAYIGAGKGRLDAMKTIAGNESKRYHLKITVSDIARRAFDLYISTYIYTDSITCSPDEAAKLREKMGLVKEDGSPVMSISKYNPSPVWVVRDTGDI